MRNCIFLTILLIFSAQLLDEVFCSTIVKSKLPTNAQDCYKKFAEDLNKSLNPSVDPCVNYYKYTCNNHNKSIEETRDLNAVDLEKLLETYYSSGENNFEAGNKMKDFINSCINLKGKQNVKDFLRSFSFPNSIGGWPYLTPNWEKNKFDLSSALAELKNYEIINFITYFFNSNGQLVIHPAGTYHLIYGSAEEKKLRTKILDKLNLENTEEVNRDQAHLEDEYIKCVKESQVGDDIVISFAELGDLSFSDFNFKKYFDICDDNDIKPDQEVIIKNPETLKKLFARLSEMEPKVVANYLFWSVAQEIANINQDKSFCFNEMFFNFKEVISKIVFDLYYDVEFKEKFLDLTRLLIDTSKNSLNVMPETTTDYVLKGVEEMFTTEYVPSLSDENLNKFYTSLKIDPENYYENIFQLRLFYEQRFSKKSSKIQNKFLPFDILRYIFTFVLYQTHDKPFVFFFDRISLPIIVDITSRQKPSEEYNNKIMKCFGDDDLYLEPFVVHTMGLNIYMKAFKKWIEENKDLTDMENKIYTEYGLSNEKILFNSLSDVGCVTTVKGIDPEMVMLELLRNLEEFSEAYNCPVGSPMNPENKCDYSSNN